MDAPAPSIMWPVIVSLPRSRSTAAGGEAEYAEFREGFKSARTPQEEQRYLYALAGFMISRSDNSASDTLLHLLGREKIEATVSVMDAPGALALPAAFMVLPPFVLAPFAPAGTGKPPEPSPTVVATCGSAVRCRPSTA